jgi:hypothetical protein
MFPEHYTDSIVSICSKEEIPGAFIIPLEQALGFASNDSNELNK